MSQKSHTSRDCSLGNRGGGLRRVSGIPSVNPDAVHEAYGHFAPTAPHQRSVADFGPRILRALVLSLAKLDQLIGGGL